ncbi:MAG TPA: hypothetical protein VFQ85_03070 [Mycobacteriales bacterium]|jgi:hypothetical protein|nr:hypothetical protein [Mycobacteriales bacterium]
MSHVRSRVLTAGAIAVALSAGYLAQGTYAAGVPANKVAASGSETELVNAQTDTVVLSETVKINNPTDLIINASAECAILTQVTNSANGQTERAFGQVKFYVTIDGIRVPVSQSDTDRGEVVYCNRAQEQQWTDSDDPITGGDDSGDQLRQYLDTRTANSFQWLALNVGTTYPGTSDNVHKVELWAHWDVAASKNAVAKAAVGNRTLVLEPVKAAVGETVVEVG